MKHSPFFFWHRDPHAQKVWSDSEVFFFHEDLSHEPLQEPGKEKVQIMETRFSQRQRDAFQNHLASRGRLHKSITTICSACPDLESFKGYDHLTQSVEFSNGLACTAREMI